MWHLPLGAGVDSMAPKLSPLSRKGYLRHYRVDEGFGQDNEYINNCTQREIQKDSKLPDVIPVDVTVAKT